jgi:hypothetical protein
MSVTRKYAKQAESSDYVTMTSLERGGSSSVASDVFGKIAVGIPT